MTAGSAIRAIANERRLLILEWLKDPRAYFPTQVDGNLVRDGVCGVLIARKLGVSQPTVSQHMKVLTPGGWSVPSASGNGRSTSDEQHIREIKTAVLARV